MLAARNSVGYETVKTGIIGMTREMAVDFGPEGVRVNGKRDRLRVKVSLLAGLFFTHQGRRVSHLPGYHRAQT